MEWLQPILGSFLGTSPVAAISFYWARVATSDRKDQEKQCRVELQEKDKIIAEKDDLIQALQNQRVADLREVMVGNTKPKLLVSKPPF